MDYSFSQYLVLFSASFLTVGILTPIFRKIAINKNIVDRPNSAHKTHKQPVPYLGGVAIVIGVVAISYIAIFINDHSVKNLLLASSILIPAVVMSYMGLIDDIKGLAPWPRLIVQTVTGIIVAALLISTNTIGTPANNLIVDAFITIFWIVGITNSINFFDNLDGGAAGAVAAASFFTFLIAFAQGQILVSALAVVIAGAMIGFLLWNKVPAKIYMGDSGSLFLGILISVLTIRLNPNVKPVINSWAVPVMLLAVPILDTSVAVISRLSRRISPFTGGRDHLSHRLIRIGIERKKTALSLWTLSVVFAFGAYLVVKSGNSVITLASLILWFGLFLFFIRIPATD